MISILLDTNIVIDLLASRKPFYAEAAELFTLADKKTIRLSVSALSIANTHYIVSKFTNDQQARKILRNFKVIVDILPLDDKVVDLALNSDFKDFADAIQYFTAIENDQKLIITRNKSDFKDSKIPFMTAAEYIKSITV
jgi:predicted nucleic acid-binding protein